VRVLNVFDASDINMSLVESRPAKTVLGRYVFLVDVDGHRQDPHIARALEFIIAQGFATGLRILGSYPRANDK
jgi:prephenate dehydratase